MDRHTHPQRRRLVAFIKRYMLAWYGGTLVLYAGMIPLTVIVFPATTLLLSIFVLFAGFTASVASFASALISAEQDRATQELASKVDEPTASRCTCSC